MAKLFNEVLGKEIAIADSPERIVSFSPAATETLFQLGLGERIVGVSAFCARPPEARSKRKLGSYNTVREEALDELEPDLILTVTGYQRDFAVKLSKKYPAYPLELPVSVAGIIDFVTKVGLVAGAPEESRELAGDLLRKAGRLRRGPELKSYVEIDLGGPVSFGAHSFITDAFRLLGSAQIYEREHAEWLKPDLGWVAAQDPDLIVYEPKMFSKFDRGNIGELVTSKRWGALRAARHGNVFVTPGPLDFLAHHGPSFITDVLPWLEGTLRTANERIGS